MTSQTETSPEPSPTYDAPAEYSNLDEVAAPSPTQNIEDDNVGLYRHVTLEERTPSPAQSRAQARLDRHTSHRSSRSSRVARRLSRSSHDASTESPVYDVPENYAELDEVLSPSPVQNFADVPLYRHETLESRRSRQLESERSRELEVEEGREAEAIEKGDLEVSSGPAPVSRFTTKLYTVSYLILFSFFGTLARLGLQALTFYPGAPSVFGVLWANFGGSLIMGFLSEDRMLFKNEWGTPVFHQRIEMAKRAENGNSNSSGESVEPAPVIDLVAAKKEHAATKKTIPLYIGLATGFCGSFTSFSSFIRDVFLALANRLPTPLNHPADYGSGTTTSSTVHRNGGYSFMALLAVIIITVSVSLSGLHIGAHLALYFEPWTPTLPVRFTRKVLDPLGVILAWGCWLGAILLAVLPPDRSSGGTEIWRGRAVFALVFAPLGCLGRFYASLYLNGKMVSFPLGTFAVNIFGTAILGMTYDLQHVPLGGVIGCQVLQGIEDGFCGCLTTVSTWVAELTALKRRHAYRYGVTSVLAALGCLIVIMGGMLWSRGWTEQVCVH